MPTVTPRKSDDKRTIAESAPTQMDSPVANNGSSPKQLRIDKRLESARQVFESQPSSMIVPLSSASLAMHSASSAIRLKRNGVSNLETNDDLFPKSINFKPKFDAPKDLLSAEETIKAAAEFDKLIHDTKIKAKELIVKQGYRTIRHMEKERQELFIEHTVTLAGHYATYHRTLSIVPLDTKGLTDRDIGSTSLYCHFNALDASDYFFEQYLFEKKESFMLMLKNAVSKSANGGNQFNDTALNRITGGLKLPVLPEAPVTPLSINPYRRIYNNTTDTMETEEEVNEFDTPTNCKLISAVANALQDVLAPVFCDTAKAMALVQQEKVANATLAAEIKKTASLDLAKDVQSALDEETSVEPHNMQAVVATHAEKLWSIREKKMNKSLRKNTSGGAQATVTNPNVRFNGEELKEKQKKPPKKGKQSSTKHSLSKKAK
jgi:hypothetical protein